EYLSYHDQLTGLYNRRYFEQEISNLDNEDNYPLTLALLDINGLKLTNDAFGHLSGDLALQMVSTILKDNCKKNDSVSRIGGDEFVMLFPNTNYDEAEKIMKKIEKETSLQKVSGVNLSISYGWSTKQHQDTTSIMDLFIKAEDEMYSQKLSESQSMRHRTIDIIMNTLFEKSPREESHSKRVAAFSGKVGKALGLREQEIHELRTAGLLHDIGKIIIQDDILNNPGALSPDELKIIKKHSETGYKILSSVNEFANIAVSILQHHERVDGKGYPMGIGGSDIVLYAKIICIADAYDAMTSDRPYRRAMKKEDALKELKLNAGKQFDQNLTDIFVDIIENNK
ncbi:diguanylate cyclase, partial [bacterium]|nr:diguanylate cyclase [bacterium]